MASKSGSSSMASASTSITSPGQNPGDGDLVALFKSFGIELVDGFLLASCTRLDAVVDDDGGTIEGAGSGPFPVIMTAMRSWRCGSTQ